VFRLPIKNMFYTYTQIVNCELLFSEYQRAAKRMFLFTVKYPEIVGGTDRIENFIKRKVKPIRKVLSFMGEKL